MELDLLRFGAAAAVLCYHFAPRLVGLFGSAVPAAFVSASRFGYLGVDLFFMISGFVIAMSASGRTARSFLIHRVIRLYPSFWFAVVATTIVTAWLTPTERPTVFQFVANLSMLPGYLGAPLIDDVYWTLGVEWKFYAIVALILAVRFRERFDLIALLWIAMTGVVIAGFRPGWLRAMLMYPYGPEFAVGMLAFSILKSGASTKRVTGALIGIAGSAFLSRARANGFIPDVQPTDLNVVSTLVIALGGMLLAVSIAGPRLRRSELIIALGSLTYPVYLLHSGVGQRLLEHWVPTNSVAMNAVLSLLMLGALCLLVSELIERRLVPRVASAEITRRISGESARGKPETAR